MTEEELNGSSNLTWYALNEYHKIYLKEEPRDAFYKISTNMINDN